MGPASDLHRPEHELGMLGDPRAISIFLAVSSPQAARMSAWTKASPSGPRIGATPWAEFQTFLIMPGDVVKRVDGSLPSDGLRDHFYRWRRLRQYPADADLHQDQIAVTPKCESVPLC